MKGVKRVLLACAAAVAIMAAPTSGQSILTVDARSTEMTREELQAAINRLDEAAASPGYSAALRAQARREAEFIRNRLEQGDFRVGDQVVLRMERGVGADTLTVQPGQVITLPDIGEVSLEGVLRSELETHLQTELGRFLQDPDVRAQALIRIAVLGHVGSQGFYAIPAEALVEDALMIAGGPAGGADLEALEIRRGDRVIWGGESLQQALIDGRTLDQMNLRAGDRIIVPEEKGGILGGRGVLGLVTLASTVVLLAFRFARIF